MVPARLMELRALVVDDNASARDILSEALRAWWPAWTRWAAAPRPSPPCKQHDAAAPYDVVFMDWRMPGVDGLEATRRIKQDAAIRRQPAW